MRIAILDPFAGIAGDMLLGALLDAGVDPEWLRALPGVMGLPDVGVRIERVERCSLACTKVDFAIPSPDDAGHGRHLHELIELVERAEIPDDVRDRAVAAFRLIGEAEGAVHGVTPERVHLHEVGAVDAVLDLVGGVWGMQLLGVEAVHHFPVALGTGWVDAAHGTLPVPAPATASLLAGIEIRDNGPVEGEATTPTGAALLRVLSAGPPPEGWRLSGVGWGAGTRDPDGYPNVVRLVVAEAATEAAHVDVLATDVDDLTPEYLEPLRQAVTEAGALECVVWPTHGKKGRVALRIEVVTPPHAAEAVTAALFAHSTTGGIRRTVARRSTLERVETAVELEPGLRVGVKVWNHPSGTRFKAEFDDVVVAADRLERSPLDVARAVEQLAAREWDER
jgi:uncharacterized protein (TIGR00299 family) protein